MRSANQKTRDVIMAVYRSQLKKLKSLAVYDDDGNFLYGGETEFGTKVSEHLIKITEKRLHELVNQNLNRRGIPPIENHTNGKAK